LPGMLGDLDPNDALELPEDGVRILFTAPMA
jgi:hypothetical protein